VVDPEELNCLTMNPLVGFGLDALIVGALSLLSLVERENERGGGDLFVTWFSWLAFLLVRPSQFKRML